MSVRVNEVKADISLFAFSDVVHRKSDVRKKGKTRGWEMMLSYSFKTGITSGYIKGTPSSDVVTALSHLQSCASQIGHPLLLSTILLAYDLSPANDQKQRDARDWVRRLENAVSLRDEIQESEMYFQDGLLEIDGLSRDLVECHGHVMWKRPQAYMALCDEMIKAMDTTQNLWSRIFTEQQQQQQKEKKIDDMVRRNLGTLPSGQEGEEDQDTEAQVAERKAVDAVHRSMISRIGFYKVKLKGLENYIFTTLERLKVQREAVSSTPPILFPPYDFHLLSLSQGKTFCGQLKKEFHLLI